MLIMAPQTHQTEGIRGTVVGPLLRRLVHFIFPKQLTHMLPAYRNLRNSDATEETPKYHAEGGLHIKVDMLTYRLFFVSRTEETYCRERSTQEVRQLDDQVKKTVNSRNKRFDAWLANKVDANNTEGRKQDEMPMEM